MVELAKNSAKYCFSRDSKWPRMPLRRGHSSVFAEFATTHRGRFAGVECDRRGNGFDAPARADCKFRPRGAFSTDRSLLGGQAFISFNVLAGVSQSMRAHGGHTARG